MPFCYSTMTELKKGPLEKEHFYFTSWFHITFVLPHTHASVSAGKARFARKFSGLLVLCEFLAPLKHLDPTLFIVGVFNVFFWFNSCWHIFLQKSFLWGKLFDVHSPCRELRIKHWWLYQKMLLLLRGLVLSISWKLQNEKQKLFWFSFISKKVFLTVSLLEDDCSLCMVLTRKNVLDL